MKIEIFDTKEFVEVNDLKPVTSPIIFQRGNVPDPNGLLSNQIFGISVNSRRHQFSYIDLGMYFFNPHVYKSFKRLFRNIEYIVNGTKYYIINEKGELVEDEENGQTGLEWVYKNWDKIKWERTVDDSAMRKERIDLITKTPKEQIFTRYQIVIPVFYRDVINKSSGGGETDPLNNLYAKQIRLAAMIKDRDMFDFTLHSTIYTVQNLIVEIYDSFKKKIERKNGMIRKYLMGKNVDNCARSVICCPLYHDETPETTPSRFGYTGIPVSQICSLCYPFMQAWIRDFFDREFIQVQEMKTIKVKGKDEFYETKLYRPELFFTDKYIKTLMDRYIHDPESRFAPLVAPIGEKQYAQIIFTGKKLDPSGTHELSNISNRPMTVTDLLYLAAVDVTKGKHALITRYPVSDAYGLFISYVTPITTLRTEVVKINDRVYTHYPMVEVGLSPLKVPIRFVDSLQFSNSYLDGLGGDYDGDQVTVKILWTQEANAECEKVMNSKSFFISPSGSNVRKIKYECLQTMYDMTKDPDANSKVLSVQEKKELLERDPKDFTFSFLTSIFADTNENGKRRKSKYACNDIINLNVGDFHNTSPEKTTVGRVVWNKVMIDRVGVRQWFAYSNQIMTKETYMSYESAVTLLLREEMITPEVFRTYIDHRDWLGLQLQGLITISFTEKTISTPKDVKELREKLFTEHDKELKAGDINVANKIEQELIKTMVDDIKDDPGFDLYASGARGDINNHMKNIFLMRGAVLNPNTGKYEVMKTAFNEGLQKEDFTPASNSVVQGAYPKAVFYKITTRRIISCLMLVSKELMKKYTYKLRETFA